MRLDHSIFNGPLKPELEMVAIDTPENYSHYPAGEGLGETLDAWQVQQSAFPDVQPGLVSDPFGFEDSPDTEWISGGLNSKGPNSLALGRQANLFMWGFFGDPNQLTASGRRVLLNSICYISKFGAARPLVSRVAPDRERVFLYLDYVRERHDHPRTQEIVDMLFPAELLQQTDYNAEAISKFYTSNLEYLRRVNKQFVVDEELKQLGLSNRTRAFLDLLIKRLGADPLDELATRLAERYIDGRIMPSSDDLAPWLGEQRNTLFFSDVGGFKWFSPKVSLQPESRLELSHFEASLESSRALVRVGQSAELLLTIELDPSWHTYSPDSVGGFPLGVEVLLPAGLSLTGGLEVPEGERVLDPVLGSKDELDGRFEMRQRLLVNEGCTSGPLNVTVKLSVTVCTALQCLPPQELTLETRLFVEQ